MNPIFPATYSTLCPGALSALITAKYGLGSVQCQLLACGVGDTYLAEAAAGRFILRVYRSLHRSLLQIEAEVSLLVTLHSAGVPVSYPVADAGGNTIQPLDATEGLRHAVLFTYAPGHVASVLHERQLSVLGREMARFHNVSADMGTCGERWAYDIETTLHKPLELLKNGPSGHTEDYTWLCQAALQAEYRLQQTDTTGLSQGYCHFDFLPKNFHFDGDSITFFDFDFMGRGLLVSDIMTFWQHLMLEAYTGRMTREDAHEAYSTFLEGYRAQRTVADAELALVPYLTLGFWLFYMGFHTTHDRFTVFAQPRHVKYYTGFLKHIVANYWQVKEE